MAAARAGRRRVRAADQAKRDRPGGNRPAGITNPDQTVAIAGSASGRTLGTMLASE
jgi:hypothetical protein